MGKSFRVWFGNLLLLVILINTIRCKSAGKDSGQGAAKIITGKEVRLVNETVSVDGGQVSVKNSGTPLDGLTIDVPADAYDNERNFEISYAPIKSYDCGPLVHPLTPLISISNGGGYSTDLMAVTIPVKVPAGQFAMAFLYNDKTGKLEGLPLAASEPDHVTILTRNFSHTSAEASSPLAAGVFAGKDVTLSQILVSAVDEKELMKDHLTPFKPGEDNWQFTNYGSYIAPKGHCSGQSMGMLWYYTEKKLRGSPPLYHRFDNDDKEPRTPYVWQDDVMGYKFCSLLQKDWSLEGENSKLFEWQKIDATRMMKAFSYALRVTNEPQFVYIATANMEAAHAIVAYGIQQGDLMVSDPNSPWSTETRIKYDPYGHTYADYSGTTISGGTIVPFTKFFYMAKTAVYSWETAEKYWKTIADKTIGEGAFPSFEIYALNEQNEFVPLADNFVVPLGGRLTVSIRCPGAEVDYMIFNKNGIEIPHDGSSALLPEADLQHIGICVVSAGTKSWIGFKWFTVKVASSFEQPETVQPASGSLSMELTIDGVAKQIDTAGYTIDDYGAITITGWGPRLTEGIYAWPYYVKIHVRNWKGLGRYQLDDGGEGTHLWQYHDYPAEKNRTNNLDIKEWRYGSLQGYFNFEAVDAQGMRKKVDGSFKSR